MSPDEIRSLIKRSGKTQLEFADWLGIPHSSLTSYLVNPKSVRYRNPPAAIIRLMEIAQREIFGVGNGISGK